MLPRSTRVSLGIDRRYKQMQASATYAYIRGGAVLRGENLNAPVNGVRPDARYANVIEVVSDGSGRQHQAADQSHDQPGRAVSAEQERTTLQRQARRPCS